MTGFNPDTGSLPVLRIGSMLRHERSPGRERPKAVNKLTDSRPRSKIGRVVLFRMVLKKANGTKRLAQQTVLILLNHKISQRLF